MVFCFVAARHSLNWINVRVYLVILVLMACALYDCRTVLCEMHQATCVRFADLTKSAQVLRVVSQWIDDSFRTVINMVGMSRISASL